jgi:hypothetical protein
MKVIIIGAIVIFVMPFIVFGMLVVFAGVGLSGWRRNADSLRMAQSGDATGGPAPDADPGSADGA